MQAIGFRITENSKNYPNLDEYLDKRLDDRFKPVVAGMLNPQTREMIGEDYHIFIKQYESMTDEQLTQTMTELEHHIKAIGLHPVSKYISV